MKKILLSVLLVAALSSAFAQNVRPVWNKQQAFEWYDQRPWLRGCDFIPSTAINQLEMWQAETFDTATIDRELGYAESIGLNCMRVFLHHVAWQQDPQGFKDRMTRYLSIADRHGIITMFVFFDDCWNATYKAGKQPAPKPGIHNSGWVKDPGQLYYEEPKLVDTLEMYVKDVMTTFKDDKRILLWDLYNEPGNGGYKSKSLPLLTKVFTWGRQVNPSQPLSSGIWNKELTELNTYQLANSDVITYHDYNPVDVHQHTIDTLKPYGRPLLCTEYMARPRNSTFETVMPMLKKNFVTAINWGLVEGKTNTKYAWDTPMPNGDEPKLWFHEIFRKDGTPYKQEETAVIKELTTNP
jgi:hypothetical protein